MEETKQEWIMIGEVNVPVIEYEEEYWYPVKYYSEKLFHRNGSFMTKEMEVNLGLNYNVFTFDYGVGTGGIQKVKCINKEAWNIALKGFRTGGYSLEQKKGYNALITHLGLTDFTLLIEKELNPSTININEELEKHDEFIQDCIKEILLDDPDIEWRTCSRCGNSYPLHNNFFHKDGCKGSSSEYVTFCKQCRKAGKINSNDKELTRIYYENGLDTYRMIKNHEVIDIYQWCIKNENTFLHKTIKNKEDYLIIIKYLYDKGFFTKDELTIEMLEEKFSLNSASFIITSDEVYTCLFGEYYKLYPWRYKKLSLRDITYEDGIQAFKNYLDEFNIKIDNIFEFNYSEHLKKARLTYFFDDILSFVVRFYNNEYAGYQFKISSKNYWKKEENRIFDLKYFIEKDLKIVIEKIPLYLTKNTLQRNARSLYTLLYNGNYYKSLYEWVNAVYPNKFDINDFIINPYRNEFDSDEECMIDDILHSKFENIIYNQNNTDRTVKFSGKIPDWFIFTDKGVVLVEYFGLYTKRNYSNSRLDDYVRRSDEKMEIYSKLNGYRLLYFYPEDVEHDYKGVRDKIENLIKELE